MILILTNEKDEHADHVINMLAKQDVASVRFDSVEFPQRASISVQYGPQGACRQLLRSKDASLDLNSVKVVWYRRPGFPVASESLPDKSAHGYVTQECYLVLQGLMRSAAQAALDLLSDMTRLRTQPEEAKRMLQSLNSRHADVTMRLLWEVQSYDGSVHYDVLVSSRGGETISLSLSPARSLPWPLRGILRWTEADLVQVNGRRLTIESATCFLDVLWNKLPLMEKIIDLCLLKDELEREPIVVDDDALQDGMDALRRAHGLYTSEATESWMRLRGFTQLQLESMVSEHLAHERLQQRAVAGEVAGYLDSRMHELDVARVALIEVASEATAFRLREKVSNGASGFVAAMHEAFVTGDPGTTCRFATLRRREAASDIETQLFAAVPGEVVGPVRTGASYVLGCLLDAVQPCDTATAHAAAEQVLFDEWLRSRRSEAAVTWHWGRLPAESQGPT